MNHTHISVINAINKLKQLNTNINMIPQSLSTDQEQAICRNCQVFTKQLTKISIENQRLDQINAQALKHQQQYKALEELYQLKCQQIELLKAHLAEVETQKLQMKRKFQDFKKKSLKTLNLQHLK